jgi:hypothetical protein
MKKKLAVFAPVKNEFTFSRIWFNYYSKFIPKEDIYFLDFGSDYTTYHTNIIHSKKNILDAVELWEAICDTHRQLLEQYEWVIPTDIDEIMWHPEGLLNYVSRLEVETVKCCGYNLIHLPDKEPPLDFDKPILSQRKYWYRDAKWYDKTIVVKKTLTWWKGLHHCKEEPDLHDEQLILIHLHKFDYQTTIKRHEEWSDYEWSKRSVDCNWTWHYRLKGQRIIDQYWDTKNNEIEIIPPFIRMLQPF